MRNLRDGIDDDLDLSEAGAREGLGRAMAAIDAVADLAASAEKDMLNMKEDRVIEVIEALGRLVKQANRHAAHVDNLRLNQRRRLIRREVTQELWDPHEALIQHPALKKHCANFEVALRSRFGNDLSKLQGTTILVPNDGAFLGDLPNVAFEADCWLVHVVDAPYLLADLCNYNSGCIQPRHADNRHALRFRHDTRGKTIVWLESA